MLAFRALKSYKYDREQAVVLDEADTMFDKGFASEVRALLRALRSKEPPARCILVLATLHQARFYSKIIRSWALCKAQCLSDLLHLSEAGVTSVLRSFFTRQR